MGQQDAGGNETDRRLVRALSIAVPEVLTPRLRLRGPRPSDLEAYAAMWAEPSVTRYIGGGSAMTVEDSWARLLRAIGHWSIGFGPWISEDRADGSLIGEVGLFDFRRTMTPPPPAAPECGWVLAPRAHGRGLATEAVHGVLAWADARGVGAIWCMIDPDHSASLRVAAKLGFAASHVADRRGAAVTVLLRPPAGAAAEA